MIKINLSHSTKDWPFLRQTPGGNGVIGNYRFYENESEGEFDYWVVLENLPRDKETISCRNNTILITAEPPSVKSYQKKFTSQFHLIITNHRNLNHKNKYISQTGLPWHIGRRQREHRNISFSKGYDELIKIKKLKKNKLISVVISNKSFTKGHKIRLRFVEKMVEHFGEKLDLFGRGFTEIEDKWDALSDYKYHLALENSSLEDYWTEKLSDAYLGWSYPFYYGCTNIDKYFSRKAFTYLNIHDVKESIETIEKAIENKTYENSLAYLKKARDDVLDNYNLFSLIISVIESNFQKNMNNGFFNNITLYSEKKSGLFSLPCGLKNKVVRFLNRD